MHRPVGGEGGGAEDQEQQRGETDHGSMSLLDAGGIADEERRSRMLRC